MRRRRRPTWRAATTDAGPANVCAAASARALQSDRLRLQPALKGLVAPKAFDRAMGPLQTPHARPARRCIWRGLNWLNGINLDFTVYAASFKLPEAAEKKRISSLAIDL